MVGGSPQGPRNIALGCFPGGQPWVGSGMINGTQSTSQGLKRKHGRDMGKRPRFKDRSWTVNGQHEADDAYRKR